MLKTDYKDYIPTSGAGTLRKYQRIDNGDGTVSFQDVTEYAQTGDKNQASVINSTNAAVNEINTSKGEAGGFATLDEYGHIPREQINMPEPTYSGKLVVHVTRYDGGEIGTTKVRVQNAALGMDLSYTPDALGNVILHLVGNKTYSISLVNVPDPYYGEAETQYIGFDTENELALQVKDQPDIIGFQINLSTGAVDYTDGAADWTPMSMNGTTLEPGSFENSWLVKDVRPCLVKNGVVQYYLKKIDGFMMFDYTLKENGDPSDITTGNDGDVMIEIPKVYMQSSIETVLNVQYLHVRFAKQPLSGYSATFIFGSPPRDSIYYAAYKPWMANQSSSPLSLSGQAPVLFITPSQSSQNESGLTDVSSLILGKIYSKHLGTQDINTRDIMFLYELYIMLFKTHDLAAFGYSNVTSSSSHTTGSLNAFPLCYISNGRFKFLGIEDPFSQITSFSFGYERSYMGYAPGPDEVDISLLNNTIIIPSANYNLSYYVSNESSFSISTPLFDLGNVSSMNASSTPMPNFAIDLFPNLATSANNCRLGFFTVNVSGPSTHHITFDGQTGQYHAIVYANATGDISQAYNYSIKVYLTFKYLEPIS